MFIDVSIYHLTYFQQIYQIDQLIIERHIYLILNYFSSTLSRIVPCKTSEYKRLLPLVLIIRTNNPTTFLPTEEPITDHCAVY